MMLLLKGVILQSLWFVVIALGDQYYYSVYLLSLVVLFLNFMLFKTNVTFKKYILFTLGLIIWGLASEGLTEIFGLISFGENGFPLWPNSLYILFVCYYADIFLFLRRLSLPLQSLIGGVGGVLAFYSGSQLSAITVHSINYWPVIFVIWAIFMPLSSWAYQQLEFKSE